MMKKWKKWKNQVSSVKKNKDQEEKTMAAELAGKTGLVAGLGRSV